MSRLTFKVTGDRLIDLRLSRLPKKVRQKVIQRAIRPEAERIKSLARAGAPRDTGALARAHRLKRFVKRDRSGYRVGTFGRRTSAKVGGKAMAIELGRKRRRPMPGSRHLRRPFYASQRRIVRKSRQTLISALRQKG